MDCQNKDIASQGDNFETISSSTYESQLLNIWESTIKN